MRVLVLLFFLFQSVEVLGQADYTAYVNPFIGTGGHGHTFPGATAPFGMVQLSPDSRIDNSWDGCGGYHYSDTNIYGFSHTHLSGTGVSDYGDILLLPFTGNFDPRKKYFSSFDHEHESASPGYYSVRLKDFDIQAELTCTERVGFHKYSFPETAEAGLLIDLRHRDELLSSEIAVIDDKHLEGYRRSTGWARDQIVFFRIEFSSPFRIDTILCDSISSNDFSKKKFMGKVCAAFRFDNVADHTLKIKVAISAVDAEGAGKNMKEELPGWDFEKTRKEMRDRWNKELSKIEVSGGTKEQFTIFYTALYHCMIAPNIYNDVDGRYRGRDFKIYKATSDYYTVFSLWDTFRAWHPLMTIIDQQRTIDFIRTFLRQYEKGNLLPVWELSSNETECMIGYHSVSVITDAYMKGIGDFNDDEIMNAMRRSAEAKDRFGLGAYMNHGYLDVLDESESVSKTLEYSYDDWCISEFASRVGRKELANKYRWRSAHWQNLFDQKTKFIRPRKNGAWLEPFDPHEVNNNFTEANAWQYTFFVPHDIPALICKLGGEDSLESKLDQLFSADNQTTGREQADITGLIGQYAHGNEPSHHMAYLYNFTRNPWKTQSMVAKILNEMYHATPDGLIGNEDCGQMSAWYVMSAMGLYQVCPGRPVYDLTTPLFDEIRIHLENGRTTEISRKDFSDKNIYIKKISLNGHQNSYWVNHSFLKEGSKLQFDMGDEKTEFKNLSYGDKRYRDSISHRLTRPCHSEFISSPVPEFSKDVFRDFTDVKFYLDSMLEIYYTLDGKTPDLKSNRYVSAIRIDSSCTLKALTYDPKESRSSYVTTTFFHKLPHPDWSVDLRSNYNRQYTAGGDEGLIDGIRGDENWRKGGWQGFQGQDFVVIIDFGKEMRVSEVQAEFLQDTRSWILFPKEVEFLVSTDGESFRKILETQNQVPDNFMENSIQSLGGKINPENARFIKVIAKNYGTLPQWHAGAGGDAFIFVDEITIQ